MRDAISCWLALCCASCVPAAAADPPHALPRRVEAGGVRFAWRVDGTMLTGRVEAPTSGWIAVGFNDRPTLDGARLVMMRVRDGRAEAEEHFARPPRHFRRAEVFGGERAMALDGGEGGGRTWVRFRVPLEGDPNVEPSFAAGDPVHLVLAYSREDDFDHHSASRVGLDVDL